MQPKPRIIDSIKKLLSPVFQPIANLLGTGPAPVIFITLWIALTFIWVFLNPVTPMNIAFLCFLASAPLLYFLKIKPGWKIGLGIVMALLLVPLVGVKNISYLEIIFQICVFSALALGLNIVVGFAGLLDLGYVAFFAVGAYSWAIFGSKQLFMLNSVPGTQPPTDTFFLPANAFYLFIFLGVGLAALTGIALGLPVLRLRGDYLAIVTLGFGELIRVLANNLDKPINLTNGPQGITPIQRPILPEPILNAIRAVVNPLVGKNVSLNEFYNVFFYLMALLVILIVILVVRRLQDSKIGRAWEAIREDELAAIAMGVPLVKMKLAAFAAGASFAGAMGVLLASSRTFISPESFNFMQSIGVLSMVILGGLASIPGVIVGAAVVILLQQSILQDLSVQLSMLRQSDATFLGFAWRDLSTQLDPAKYQKMLFGLILILMMIYRPAGLIPSARRKHELARDEPVLTPPVGEEHSADEGGTHASA